MIKLNNAWVSCLLLATTFLFSCKDDSDLAIVPELKGKSFAEEFDNVTTPYNNGWRTINRSFPVGPNHFKEPTQYDGFGAPFLLWNAYSSNETVGGYIMSGPTATLGQLPRFLGNVPSSLHTGTINSWIVSPPTILKNGDKIIFYTRSNIQTRSLGAFDAFDDVLVDYDGDDRLEVRLNINNDGMNVGTLAGDGVGDFNTIILAVNGFGESDGVGPFYLSSDMPPASIAGTNPLSYPKLWTRFIATVSGLQKPVMGRFALRHYVEDAGPGWIRYQWPVYSPTVPTNLNNIPGLGGNVAIDSVAYVSN
jgi:hypothetical protein